MEKVVDFQAGLVETEVYKPEQRGNSVKLIDIKGNPVGTLGVMTSVRKKAITNGQAIQAYITKTNKKIYKRVSMETYDSLVSPMSTSSGEVKFGSVNDIEEVKNFIHTESIKLKPQQLIMSEIKWKYLIRSAVRAKNIMMTGPSGCGKTMAAKALVNGLDRPDFYFNLGATQDPRATLIGNTHFNKETGTFFAESAFVTAIKTPNAVILLDELSRAHPDAWNILMTVLDEGQRYLRLDEADGSPIVKVAAGVTFVATANIGSEYTSTRVMDRAILDRFVTIEMDVLNDEQEFGLLSSMFPDVSEYNLKAISEVAHHTREQKMSEDGKLDEMISTRATVEMSSLLYDGFSLIEAAEIAIFPFFSPDGGIDSARTYVKQLVQKYKSDEHNRPLVGDDSVTFDDSDDDIPTF